MTIDQGQRSTDRIGVGLARVDPLTADQAIDAIMAAASADAGCAVVVTPNIQHIVLLPKDDRFREAYDAAALVLPDGWPVARAMTKLTGTPVERVAGADLLAPVLARCAAEGRSVGLVGGRRGAAEAAAEKARTEHPALRISVVDDSWFSSALDDEDVKRFLAILGEGVDVLVMGLGTPKQEILLAETARRGDIPARVVLCIGAAIDFYAGFVDRAPERYQRMNMEWAYRMAQEPRRLARRYAYAAPVFLSITARDRRRARREAAGRRTSA